MSATLFDEHRLIQSAADAFLDSLRETPRIPAKIHRLRAQMAKQMNRHRASEETLILGPFKAAGGYDLYPEILAPMQAIRQEWLGYSQHVRQWTPQAMEADWESYTAAVEYRVGILRTFTAMEEREIYSPMLRFLEQHTVPQPTTQRAAML